jgi:hypothetical protein
MQSTPAVRFKAESTPSRGEEEEDMEILSLLVQLWFSWAGRPLHSVRSAAAIERPAPTRPGPGTTATPDRDCGGAVDPNGGCHP